MSSMAEKTIPMAMTGAERIRLYRERLKQNKTQYAQHLEADRNRKQIARENMTKYELDDHRLKGRQATKRWRHASQQEKDMEHDMYQQEDPAVLPLSVGLGTFKSPASFGKANKRVERVLPKSPRKRMAVVEKLASNILKVKLPRTRKVGSVSLSKDTKSMVIDFYLSDSISRQCPGKSDWLVVKNDDGSKEKRQKRHMVMTLSESYKLFGTDNSSVNIGKSSFAALRPKHVLLVSNMPHNVCGCRYHNNVILLLESLHRKVPNIPLYSREIFLPLCVCDINAENCMSNNCETCGNGYRFDESVKDVEGDDAISWFQWQENSKGYLEKKSFSGKLAN